MANPTLPAAEIPTQKSEALASHGLRLPAEWEPHEATWIAWPHNRSDWPGKLAAVHWVYAEIVRKITPGETVRILVSSIAHQARAQAFLRRAGVDLNRVEFFHLATNRSWMRDSGPLFLRGPAECAVARFRFNAWARYSDWQQDNRVPSCIARRLGCRLVEVKHRGKHLVLEGGAVDVNGRGTILATEECLLDPQVQVRNPGLKRAGYEAIFSNVLGASNVLWFGQGIVGDDTHGHIDDLCRFVGPRTVVLCREDDAGDANYRLLAENWQRVAAMRAQDGSAIEAVPLPMPAPLYFDGRRLPASYANFYVANSAVLVPTFNDPADRLALGILAELITDRPVVGIHAVDLVWGLGTLHCLTREQPRVPLAP